MRKGENKRKTLVGSKIFYFVYDDTKTDTFENASNAWVWSGPEPYQTEINITHNTLPLSCKSLDLLLGAYIQNRRLLSFFLKYRNRPTSRGYQYLTIFLRHVRSIIGFLLRKEETNKYRIKMNANLNFNRKYEKQQRIERKKRDYLQDLYDTPELTTTELN